MRNSFLPGTDSGLLAWAKRFSETINLSPGLFGISPEEAAAFASLYADFAAAMLAVAPSVRSKTAVVEKNSVRKSLKNSARLLASIVRGQATVTDSQKVELGLTVRSTPIAQPAPDDAPSISVLSVSGRRARIRLGSLVHPGTRGRPKGVDGAIIFTSVSKSGQEGSSAPVFAAITNRMKLNIMLPASAAPGEQVWIVARWFNRRKQLGPVSRAVCTNVQFGGVMSLAA